jgi:DNA-binding beta-propeller fold protein YncE
VHTFDTEVRDVEALAITPQGRMLVADIGDNDGSRSMVRVFWFDEPELGRTSGAWSSWELSYPDGPHNAESIAVDPTSGRVFVVTKDRPGAVYALPATPSRRGVNRLTKVGTAPDIATDAVFLPGGSGLAVRTYTSLVVLDPDTSRETSYQVLPLQPQGETLALAPDGKGLLVGSEGTHSRIQEVTINAPASAATTTTAADPTATPGDSPMTAGQSPSPSQTRAVDDGEGSPLVANRGELFAGLGACAGLVLLAYLISRVARRGRR